MDKITELGHYVIEYGYLAIFLLVFLQEIGIPNPITNELVLLYSGYLAYTGALSLSTIILVTVSADFIGTSILFFVFYAFGKYIVSRKPKWLPMERIETMKQRIDKGGNWGIYLGRLIPFLRGYISVGAGIVQINPLMFLTTVLTSALTWSGGLVLLGWALAPYWSLVVQRMGIVENVMLIATLVIVMLIVGRIFARRFFAPKNEMETFKE
jgi:membrane protein DedA with SNARE-associated domain